MMVFALGGAAAQGKKSPQGKHEIFECLIGGEQGKFRVPFLIG